VLVKRGRDKKVGRNHLRSWKKEGKIPKTGYLLPHLLTVLIWKGKAAPNPLHPLREERKRAKKAREGAKGEKGTLLDV